MARRIARNPRLVDRDYDILEHLQLFHLTTREVLQRLFFADAELNAVTKVTSRLVDHGFLNRYELPGGRSYFVFGTEGVKLFGGSPKRTRPFGAQSLPRDYGILHYCCMSQPPLVAYRRLVELGRQSVAFASPLARYAVLHVRNGRRVGGRQDHVDVLSRIAQRRHGFQVTSLHGADRSRADRSRAQWVDKLVVEDRRATPAEVATTRIDFRSWLTTLSSRQSCVAQALASGDTTQDAARRFQVTPGRISQIRRELAEAWSRHQGEAVTSLSGHRSSTQRGAP